MQAQDHQSQQNRQPARLVEQFYGRTILIFIFTRFYVTLKFQTIVELNMKKNIS